MLAIGVPALRIISITFVMAGVTTILGYSAAGLGNGVINMMGTAIRQFILLIPFVWLFARDGNVGTVLTGNISYGVVREQQGFFVILILQTAFLFLDKSVSSRYTA